MPDTPTPPINVFLVVDQPLQEGQELDDAATAPFSEAAMLAIHSVEQQDYPGEVDITILRNVYGASPRDLWRFAAKRTESAFIALCDDSGPWPPEALSMMMAALQEDLSVGAYGAVEPGLLAVLATRDYLIAFCDGEL